jgi:diguanylate cyclase (GGDEF)-like protein
MRITIPRGVRTDRIEIPTLRVVAGKEMLRFVTLPLGQELVLGRDEDCGFTLDDGSVSRRHARVVRHPGGDITIEDLGSTNGIAVNGYPVTKSLIRGGDHLELGAVALRLDFLAPEELRHLERVRQKLQASDCDRLTGLKTRSCLDEQIPGILESCDAGGIPVSAVFLDLDWFKSINDRFGHAVGDAVLRDAARLILLGLRDTDLCLRYGGEEILIILPGTDLEAATSIAERARLMLTSHDWARTVEGLSVSASFGVAQRQKGEAIPSWIERADRALYSAKNAGRNRVCRG